MAFTADFFDGHSAARRIVDVHASDGLLRVAGPGVEFQLPAANARVEPRLGRTPLRISLPDGGLLVAADADAVASTLPIPPARTLAHRLESHSVFVAIAVIGIAIAAWFAYDMGIPRLAREIALRVPPDSEEQFTREVMAAIDKLPGIGPSKLEAERRDRIDAIFRELTAKADVGGSVRIGYRDLGSFFGPNAFAAGRQIVLSDQLVALMDDPQVAAVLAHELGHIRHRHALRHMLSASINALAAAAIFGDVGSIAGLASMYPVFLTRSAFSRDFEREADAFAIDLLRRTGRSPRDFAAALRALEKEVADSRAQNRTTYISTHPAIEDRIREAEAASQ